MRTRAFSLVLTGLVAGLLLAPAGPAQAASPRETEAARLFFAGQYPEALKIYVDLAVATGDPVYMCEIGRCYHRMGKLEEASRNLRDCLTQAQLPAKKKREFQTLQTEVEAQRRAAAAPPPVQAVPPGYPAGPPPGAPPPGYPQAGPPPGYPPQGQQPPQGYPQQGQAYPPQGQPQAGYPPPGYPQNPQGAPPPGQPGGPQGAPPPGWGAPPPGQPPGPPPGEIGPPPGGNQLAAQADEPPAKGGGWMKPAAFIAGGVGLAGVGFGAYSGYTASKKFDEVAKEFNENKHKNAKTYNTLQFVGYGLGAAGLGAAVLFFILAPSSEARTAAGGLQIVASPESIGVAGRF